MLKLIGTAIIVTGCTLAGRTVAKAFAGRPRQLRMLQSALHELETEIVYGAAPIKEALERLSVRGDPLMQKFYELVLLGMSKNVGCRLADAWAEALTEWQGATYLTRDDLATIEVLGNSLGVSDRQDQQKHLGLAKEKLSYGESGAREVAQRAVKPWNYLGFLGGLIVVLIFL